MEALRLNRLIFFFWPHCSMWELSFLTRDWTLPLGLAAQSPNLWTCSEVPDRLILCYPSRRRRELKYISSWTLSQIRHTSRQAWCLGSEWELDRSMSRSQWGGISSARAGAAAALSSHTATAPSPQPVGWECSPHAGWLSGKRGSISSWSRTAISPRPMGVGRLTTPWRTEWKEAGPLAAGAGRPSAPGPWAWEGSPHAAGLNGRKGVHE